MSGENDYGWFCRNIENMKQTMFRVAFSILRNVSDSEDAAQNVIIKAYRSLGQLKDRKSFRTRLTHSMEVASFAKSLGQSVCQYIMNRGIDGDVNAETKEKICSILECAGLIHDIGNPPFGHFGEEAIRNWFQTHLKELSLGEVGADKLLNEQMRKDLYQFEGNAQALRLLTKLHYLVDENGMHLTYGLLNTLVKYPVSSCGTDKASGNVKDKKWAITMPNKSCIRQYLPRRELSAAAIR